MKKILALFLLLLSGNVFSENTIIAIVNNNPILLSSLQKGLLSATSKEEKIEILNAQIDIFLQLQKVNEFNLKPTKEEIDSFVIDVAKSNNISVDELINFEEIDLIRKEISDKLSILNLQRYITKDIDYPKEQVKSKCSNTNLVKDQKQIRIAQIIISEIGSDIKDSDKKIKLIKSFLNKLSKHISMGASFESFAKLHSQHPSYKDGGLTGWLTVNNPTLEMLDSLKKNEVSDIYSTIYGLAIAIKIDEQFISSKLKECEEQIGFENAEKYYSDWLNNLRDVAFVEIYYDKLI
ncbi:hypothetical protein CL646_05855 [bacterium]|mgnify:CR=1 FL=1|nr:hypothetical protein [bacterium]